MTGALLHETKTIPIVFMNVSDPVGSGFVANMARPGGNATGFTNVEASLGGKWVEVVTEMKPPIARIGVLFSPKTSPGGGAYYLHLIEAAARSIAIETVPIPVLDAAAIEHAIGEFARDPRGGLIVQPDVTTSFNRALILRLAAQYRLPAVLSVPLLCHGGRTRLLRDRRGRRVP